MNVRRYDVQLTLGVDSSGLLIRLQSHILKNEKPSTIRPTPYAAALMIGSIKKALEDTDEFQTFEFFDAEKLPVHGQFQTTENNKIGRFKRAIIVVHENLRRNTAHTTYLLVMREEELRKLLEILKETFDIQPN